MSDRYQTILLFGAPGSGKGTQGKILGAIPGFFHLSCGEVFRTLNIKSDLGRLFVEYSSRGELVPDDVTIKMWKENIKAQEVLSLYKPHDDLLILDGIPRNANQAHLMDEHISVLQVIHLVCDDEKSMFERLRRRALKENRADDAREAVIRRRWEVYQQETTPVLDYYPADRIRKVSALGSPASVLQHILELVVPVQEKHFSMDIAKH
ncbi:MAG: adenylate kinase [Planctomycetes bacterium HGW-Planctomycetes-2]|nr:MAG: adenylate kinase [Planctomycetes bacterium HGW-Planctomycetes-2]